MTRARAIRSRTKAEVLAAWRRDDLEAENARLRTEIAQQREYWADQYSRWRHERASLSPPSAREQSDAGPDWGKVNPGQEMTSDEARDYAIALGYSEPNASEQSAPPRALEVENARMREALKVARAYVAVAEKNDWTGFLDEIDAALSPPSAREQPTGIGDDEGFIVGVNCGRDDDAPSASKQSADVA